MNKKVLFIVHASVIAALYVVLTFVANAFGLANHAVQVRFSEALTVLPFFTPAAVPGLALGCLLSNILTGCALPDILFGTLATLIGAIITFLLRRNRWLAPIPPIAANTAIVPFILYYAYGFSPLWLAFITVGAGEIISCGILGMILLHILARYQKYVFPGQNHQG